MERIFAEMIRTVYVLNVFVVDVFVNIDAIQFYSLKLHFKLIFPFISL